MKRFVAGLMLAASCLGTVPAFAEGAKGDEGAKPKPLPVKTTAKGHVSVETGGKKRVSLTPEEWRHVLALQPHILDACTQLEKEVMSK